jgi:hypothetical protein
MTTRLSAALAAAALSLTLAAPADAHETYYHVQKLSHDGERPSGLMVSTGLGFGTGYGMAGTSTEFILRDSTGVAVSLNLGLGALAGLGASIWSPGQRLRIGLRADLAASWSYLTAWYNDASVGGCGYDPGYDPGYRPPPVRYDSQYDDTPGYYGDEPVGGRSELPGMSDYGHHGSSVFAAGLGAELDHDVGRPGAFSMRYGVTATGVFAGCAGGILPMPTVALRYTF